MAVLKIVQLGTPEEDILLTPTQHVRTFGPELHTLLDNMLETMHDANGAGLAAPQVGIAQRITVLEHAEDDEDPDSKVRTYELINPKILKTRGKDVAQEGCLSIPGLAADVERATQVTVRAQDRHGKEFRLKAYGWLARIIQHEVDHLDGKIMLDKATQLYKVVQGEDGELELVPIEETMPE